MEVSSQFDVSAFRIEEEQPRPQTTVLIVHGEADLHSAAELRGRLWTAMEGEATGIVVDLSDVVFIDSTALGVLLGAVKRLRAEGRELRLVVPGREVRRIFELTVLDHVFALDESRADALEALAGGAG